MCRECTGRDGVYLTVFHMFGYCLVVLCHKVVPTRVCITTPQARSVSESLLGRKVKERSVIVDARLMDCGSTALYLERKVE